MAKLLRHCLPLFNEIAPLNLAEDWDQVGLQVGDPEQLISQALLTIDLTPSVLREATEQGCELIIAYHPPMFRPLERLTWGGQTSWKQSTLLEAVRRGIAVYSPHTALDAAEDGMNDWLCAGIGQGTTQPILPRSTQTADTFKIVTYAPKADADLIREALDRGGAGWIGNYRQCTFNSPGEGTFQPNDGANPSIGQIGQLTRVEEVRIEMICSGDRLPSALASLREKHPYEEPAIDVLKLEAGSSGLTQPPVPTGAGRLLTLDEPIDPTLLTTRLKRRLILPSIKLGLPQTSRPIRTVAVCVGAGGSLFADAASTHQIDAYVTGEMQHHQALDLIESGAAVALTGHTHSERPYLPVYAERLNEIFGEGITWSVSRADRAPLELV